MALNWNLLVILMLISGIGVALVPAFLNLFAPTTKKIRSLFYFKLAIIFMGISVCLDGISSLLMNITISKISAILAFPSAVFFSIGVNYTIKETYLSIHLIIIICLGVLLCYLAFQPGAIASIAEDGYLSLTWVGMFGFITDLLTVIIAIILFYWAFKTWINAPFLIKKEATVFFIGMSIAIILPSITLIFRTTYHLISNILFFSFWFIGIM